ncbi:MAG: hypothetical protein OEZ16_01565 [Chromatiales bacterium]|nr:hypothetical protein [Chromatiales bacterium]
MNPETRDFLDQVACVAQANLNYLSALEVEEMEVDEQGSQVIMGAYLELYDQFMGNTARSSGPTDFIFTAASACCGMRRQMEQRPRSDWSGDEHGLFTLMLGFMYMFKHLYVVKG